MKNVVLIDIYGVYLHSLLATNNVNVKLALFDDKNFVDKCKKNFPDAVERFYYRKPDTNEEFDLMNKTDYDLKYEDLEKFRNVQLKVEHFLHRELNNDASIQYRYLTALRFFLGFFEENKIDMVFCAHMEHGAIWDSLIFEIAKSKNIPVYINVAASTNRKENINCITDYNKKELCNLEFFGKEKINSTLFFDSLNDYSKIYLKPKKSVSEKIEDRVSDLKSKLKFISKEFEYAFSNFKTSNYDKDNYLHQEVISESEINEKNVYLNKLKKFYDKMSSKANYDEKYIFYPVHLEPEATIMARSIMTSQLYIIKLISQYLPKGWKLYVKEHPSTFSIYKSANYFYKNIEYYNSIEYYKTIKSLKNVELISLKEPVNKLIEKSQAVTTICGTALVESVLNNKPVIVWGKGLHYTEYLKDTFTISSCLDIQNALKCLNEGFTPDYSDLDDVVNRYAYKSVCYGCCDNLSDEWVKLFNYLLDYEKIHSKELKC